MKTWINKGIESLRHMSVQVKASMVFMVVNFMQKGIAFLTTPVFTRLLSTEEYGKITVYSSWLEIIGIFAMFGLTSNVYYNGILEYKKDQDNFTFSMLTLSNVITLTVMLAVWTVNRYVFHFLDISPVLFFFMFLSFFIEPAFEFWQAGQRFSYKYRLVCLFMVLVMIGSPVFSLMGIRLCPSMKVEARIIGAQLVTALLSTGCYIGFICHAGGRPKMRYWRYAVKYNLALIPFFLSNYILNGSDRLMISWYCGDDKAGIYGIGHTMASGVNIIWSSVNATLLPTIYLKCDEDRREELSGIVVPVITGFAAVCIMIMLLSPEIIRCLAPSSYGEGMYVIPVVVGGTFIMSLYTVFSNNLLYEKSSRTVGAAGIAAAVLNLVLNMIFIPKSGYLAAGYTTLCAYILPVVWGSVALKRLTGYFVYDIRQIGTVSVAVIFSSLFVSRLYDHLLLRLGILLGMLIVLWIRRKWLFGDIAGKIFR